jgi:hypothetical protein
MVSALYPHKVGVGNTTNGGLRGERRFVMCLDMADGEFKEIGDRLKAIREAFSNLSQRAWAEKHGFQPTQWNNWEKGIRRIPVDEAEKLCQLYGLTLDWIYRGRRDGLSFRASNSI